MYETIFYLTYYTAGARQIQLRIASKSHKICARNVCIVGKKAKMNIDRLRERRRVGTVDFVKMYTAPELRAAGIVKYNGRIMLHLSVNKCII